MVEGRARRRSIVLGGPCVALISLMRAYADAFTKLGPVGGPCHDSSDTVTTDELDSHPTLKGINAQPKVHDGAEDARPGVEGDARGVKSGRFSGSSGY